MDKASKLKDILALLDELEARIRESMSLAKQMQCKLYPNHKN